VTHPTTKETLLDAIRAGRARLEEVVAAIPEARLGEPGVEGQWSAKDVLAHLAFWERSMMERVRAAARGELPNRPERSESEQRAHVDRINAEAYAAAKDRPAGEVLADFRASYQEVLALVGALTPEQLFGPGSIAERTGVPVLDLIAGDTYEHYREHGDAIRAWLAS
jgi:uncharacterized protein (TIGR03083 family)